MDQDQADGDRVILLPHINSRELRNFVDNIYGEYPCHGWSDVETQQQRMIVETVTVPCALANSLPAADNETARVGVGSLPRSGGRGGGRTRYQQ